MSVCPSRFFKVDADRINAQTQYIVKGQELILRKFENSGKYYICRLLRFLVILFSFASVFSEYMSNIGCNCKISFVWFCQFILEVKVNLNLRYLPRKLKRVRFEVFNSMKMTVLFWVVTSCRLVIMVRLWCCDGSITIVFAYEPRRRHNPEQQRSQLKGLYGEC
jgi:hypothetical protein